MEELQPPNALEGAVYRCSFCSKSLNAEDLFCRNCGREIKPGLSSVHSEDPLISGGITNLASQDPIPSKVPVRPIPKKGTSVVIKIISVIVVLAVLAGGGVFLLIIRKHRQEAELIIKANQYLQGIKQISTMLKQLDAKWKENNNNYNKLQEYNDEQVMFGDDGWNTAGMKRNKLAEEKKEIETQMLTSSQEGLRLSTEYLKNNLDQIEREKANKWAESFSQIIANVNASMAKGMPSATGGDSGVPEELILNGIAKDIGISYAQLIDIRNKHRLFSNNLSSVANTRRTAMNLSMKSGVPVPFGDEGQIQALRDLMNAP